VLIVEETGGAIAWTSVWTLEDVQHELQVRDAECSKFKHINCELYRAAKWRMKPTDSTAAGSTGSIVMIIFLEMTSIQIRYAATDSIGVTKVNRTTRCLIERCWYHFAVTFLRSHFCYAPAHVTVVDPFPLGCATELQAVAGSLYSA